MTNIASVSQEQLTTRRQQLRRERRLKSVQAIWRSMFVGGMASSLIWALTLPDWVIRKPEQVVIEGNHFMTPQAIRSLLPLSYPQSLLRIEPGELAKFLESQAPIAQATVKRQLVPPGLTIQVKERRPVAIAQAATLSGAQTDQEMPATGLVDETGVFLPKSNYTQLEQNRELPTLKVIGANEQYRPYWSEVYQAVIHSPVKVFEIDWENPANLILKTELGNVHFGPYSSKFREQLAVLDRMRELPTRIQSSQIAYIDLKNPEYPAIQVKKEKETAKPGTH